MFKLLLLNFFFNSVTRFRSRFSTEYINECFTFQVFRLIFTFKSIGRSEVTFSTWLIIVFLSISFLHFLVLCLSS